MKKIFYLFVLLCTSLFVQAQILEPITWKVSLSDKGRNQKEIRFEATVDAGWHLYDMNLPEGGPVSTQFAFETLEGAELVGTPKTDRKPTAKFDNMFNMELRWYEGTVTFIQPIKVTSADKFRIVGEVEFMGCNDESCLPPNRIEFDFSKSDITSGADVADEKAKPEAAVAAAKAVAAPAAPTAPAAPAVEEQAITKAVALEPATVVETASPVIGKEVLWAPVIDELKSVSGAMESQTGSSWIYIFLAGFIGGALALLTPCVWPMIPMTVSFFLKRSKNDHKKGVGDALAYAVSIIVIYLFLGLVVTAVFGASALNELSTNAVFNLIFFGLLVLFAVSFLGAFELVLPASWTSKLDSKADSTTGFLSIFFMAFTLVLISFSCTGPIIGTLLVEAASSGSVVGPAIGMLGFALALSIPFSLFAIFPTWLQSLPKSGGWLNSVKVVLGFLELALALKFLSVADLAYGWRIMDREVFLVLWIVIFVMLGLYLLGKLKFSHDSDLPFVSVPRLFMAMISFAFALYMVPGLWGAPVKAISAFSPPLYTQDFNLYTDEVHANFDDYEAGMAHARKVNKPVIVDFSGYGCVNCRKMEASVWTNATVKQIMEEDYVLITLMVDDKTPLNEVIEVEEHGKTRKLKTVGDKWSYLQRSKFGANAQPFYVLLDTEAKPVAPAYAFDESVDNFVSFLKGGLKTFRR